MGWTGSLEHTDNCPYCINNNIMVNKYLRTPVSAITRFRLSLPNDVVMCVLLCMPCATLPPTSSIWIVFFMVCSRNDCSDLTAFGHCRSVAVSLCWRLFRPFAVSPPRRFAPWLFRPLACSPRYVVSLRYDDRNSMPTTFFSFFSKVFYFESTTVRGRISQGANEPGANRLGGETAKGRISHNSCWTLEIW